MWVQKKNRKKEAPTIHCGLYSKKEAAAMIAKGAFHIHSTTLGANDLLARTTFAALENGNVARYAWENTQHDTIFDVRASKDRYDIIRNLFSGNELKVKQQTREKAESILEELFTNAFYHGFRKADGGPKYSRRDSVILDSSEKLTVKVGITLGGLYLEVSDNGGSFVFEDVAKSFDRCYGEAGEQIESKESGAGLGLYMIFEAATHVKIVCTRGKSTTICCWIPDSKGQDPDYFSFNFFDRR